MVVNSAIAGNGSTITINGGGGRVGGFLAFGTYDSETNSYPLLWQERNYTSLNTNIEADKKYTYEFSFDHVGDGKGVITGLAIKDENGDIIGEKTGLHYRNYSDTSNNASKLPFSQMVVNMAAKDESETAEAVITNGRIIYKGTEDINVSVEKAQVIENSEVVEKTDILLGEEDTPVFYIPSTGAEFVLSNDISSNIKTSYKLKGDAAGAVITDNKLIIMPAFSGGEGSVTLNVSVDEKSDADIIINVKKDESDAGEIVEGCKRNLLIYDADGSHTYESNYLKTSSKLIFPQSNDFVDIEWSEFQSENGEWVKSDVINIETGALNISDKFDRRIKIIALIKSKNDPAVFAEKVFYIDVAANRKSGGKCGDNLEWSYADDVLTISGSGDMWNYTEDNAPWHKFSPDTLLQLDNLIIEDGVTSIGNYAFADVSVKKIFELPATVKKIGNYAFYSSRISLMGKLPESLKIIGHYAFYQSSLSGSVVIPRSVEKMGIGAFRYTAINDLVLQEGITELSALCFSQMDIKSVTIPGSVKKINGGAFDDNYNVVKITLPDSAIEIGCGLSENDDIYEEGGLYYIGRHLIEADKNITECKIKEGTLDIASDAFYKCDNLLSIDIPESVEIISARAFNNCVALPKINVSDNTYISPSAFMNIPYCNEVSNWKDGELYIGANLVEIDSSRIENGAYSIKEGTKVISDNAFAKCHDLFEVNIPDSVRVIGNGAFEYNSIEELKIPEGVTDIGDISHCNNLKSVYIPKSTKNVSGGFLNTCRNISNIYYGGSKDEWNELTTYQNESNNVVVHFNASDIGDDTGYEDVELKLVNMLPEYKDKLSISVMVSGSAVKVNMEKSQYIDISKFNAYAVYFDGDGNFIDADILNKDSNGFSGKLKYNSYKIILWDKLTPVVEAIKQ